MTYYNTLKKIYSFPRTAGAPTLERMRLLCRYLGDPQKKLKFVHIAGTNGKGSCAAMLDSILRTAGYHTGRYISPYILDFRERMTADGEMISHDELCLHAKTVFGAVAEMQKDIEKAKNGEAVPFQIPKNVLDGSSSALPVQFEVVTAIGFLYFLAHRCDAVLLECGLGGRFDATNVIDPPMVAVIMSIGLDHTELLGDTYEKIAAEKCGIIKKGTGEVISYTQSPDVMAVIGDSCVAANARITVPVRAELELVHATLGGLNFKYRGKAYKTKLAASYQLLNAATVIEVAEALSRLGMSLDYETVAAGLEKTWFPARFEVFGVNPTVIVDGAHNDSGVKALCESIDMIAPSVGGSFTFALGMLKDKDPAKALAAFGDLVRSGKINVSRIVTLTPDSPRAMSAEELKTVLEGMLGDSMPIVALNTTGRQRGKDFCAAVSDIGANDALISFGSLYLASEMRGILSDFLENYKF